jgi:hypothetical protein
VEKLKKNEMKRISFSDFLLSIFMVLFRFLIFFSAADGRFYENDQLRIYIYSLLNNRQ